MDFVSTLLNLVLGQIKDGSLLRWNVSYFGISWSDACDFGDDLFRIGYNETIDDGF